LAADSPTGFPEKQKKMYKDMMDLPSDGAEKNNPPIEPEISIKYPFCYGNLV
jgi:hypothetical protein